MSLIEVQNVGFSYTGHRVLENVSLQVNKQEVFCLLGPNGCGKTTLLDCILGLLKPQEGSIRIQDRDIRNLHPASIAQVVAYVPQNHQKTFPYRVLDIVLMGRAAYTGLFSSPSSRDQAIAEEALDMVGLLRLKSRPYTQLSGGESQLLMIARALAQQTPVLVMDEPTAHLDFRNELTVLETIVKLVQNTGVTVVLATHYPNHAFYFENNGIKTTVAIMNQNSDLKMGVPGRVLTEENLRTVYNIDARIVSCCLDDDQHLKQVIPLSTLSNQN